MSRGNRGKVLEKNILQANAYYDQQGRARVVQMPTPVNVTRVAGHKVTGFFGRSTVDFYGTLKGGRAVYFDAKETAVNTFEVLNESVMHPHQIEFLDTQHRLGAICFLVISFTKYKEEYLVPWPVFMEVYARAKLLPARSKGKSLHYNDCLGRSNVNLISTKKGYLDYLGPLFEEE